MNYFNMGTFQPQVHLLNINKIGENKTPPFHPENNSCVQIPESITCFLIELLLNFNLP